MRTPRRWAAAVEYLGTAYHGWQSQVGLVAVQAEVESALSAIADHPVSVYAAGRTDAGVHAFQQVVHFDSGAMRAPYAWLLGGNSRLKADVSLRWVQEVPADFHARHSAIERSYRYVMHVSASRSALLQGRVAWHTRELNAVAMHQAAQALVGEHDFSAFRDSECQSPSPMRNLRRVSVCASGEFVVLEVSANAFLHHMVRNIAGSLLEVGQGKRDIAWIGTVLRSRERTQAGMTAEAAGLYFIGPTYPAKFALPPLPQAWFPPL